MLASHASDEADGMCGSVYAGPVVDPLKRCDAFKSKAREFHFVCPVVGSIARGDAMRSNDTVRSELGAADPASPKGDQQ